VEKLINNLIEQLLKNADKVELAETLHRIANSLLEPSKPILTLKRLRELQANETPWCYCDDNFKRDIKLAQSLGYQCNGRTDWNESVVWYSGHCRFDERRTIHHRSHNKSFTDDTSRFIYRVAPWYYLHETDANKLIIPCWKEAVKDV